MRYMEDFKAVIDGLHDDDMGTVLCGGQLPQLSMRLADDYAHMSPQQRKLALGYVNQTNQEAGWGDDIQVSIVDRGGKSSVVIAQNPDGLFRATLGDFALEMEGSQRGCLANIKERNGTTRHLEFDSLGRIK